MRRALVTGASGFLGHHLVPALLREGVQVVALARQRGALSGIDHPQLSVALGDVRDAALCSRLLSGADVVLHLAGVRGRPGSAPAAMAEVNEVATVRLAQQAARAGVARFVSVATALVYGPSSVPLDETAPVVPERAGGAYGASRARAMLALRALAREGVPVVTICPSIVYGPDHPSRPNRVTSHLRRLLRFRVDLVLGGGAARRDLVHAGDVVAALLAAARRPGLEGEEVLVTGEPVSQRSLATLAARCAGRRPPRALSLPPRAAAAAARLLDRGLGYDRDSGLESAVATLAREWIFAGDKARALLGHRPRPLAEGVAQTVAWIRGEGTHER